MTNSNKIAQICKLLSAFLIQIDMITVASLKIKNFQSLKFIVLISMHAKHDSNLNKHIVILFLFFNSFRAITVNINC